MTTKIHAPVKDLTAQTYIGPLILDFKDGVAETDAELNDGIRSYLRTHGYGIDTAAEDPEPQTPTVPDPRDHEPELVGTALRDAAVDPRPEDFLAPVNAGEPGELGNPHGPEVVSPGIHAVNGPGPIVPGTVGSADYQDAKESATADAVLRGGQPATEVGAALGDLARQEYELTGKDGLAREVKGVDQADVEAIIEDGPSPEATADPAPEPDPIPDPIPENETPTAPAGNASRDEWAAYVTALGEEPGDRGRDELRAAYGPKA